MAKEDFCFTYYDGDAARDKAHMSRLERGAYDDIISAQRKRGHLSIDDIKKVLSKDFESCWESLEWVLEKDEEGKYFIQWVDKSVSDMKKNSQKNKEKIDQYWADVKSGKIPAPVKKKNTTVLPQYNNGIDLEYTKGIPLEDGDEDGNESILGKEGVGEKPSYQPSVLLDPSGEKFPIEQCLQIALRDDRWVKANKTNEAELKEFNAMLERIATYHETPIEYKRYFGNWKAKGKLDFVKNQNTEKIFTPVGTGELARQRKLLNGK